MTRPKQDGRTLGLTPSDGEVPGPVRVRAVEGPGAGPQAMLDAGSLVVGSGQDGVDLVLADPGVSRRHLVLQRVAGGVRVRDLQSRNGTRYLGSRIEEVVVPVGATLRIGHTTLQLAPPDDAAPLSDKHHLEGLCGRSVAMRRLFAQLERLGPSEVTVLIEGETGAGKERVARALHALSPRARQPFVAFDCAAAEPELVERELFGHLKGAFTGASETRAGLFAAAEGGTLLLAGVDELPASLQPKLLRVLETREVRPLGAAASRKANVRVLADTQRNLEEAVKARAFRADLYFRLAVATVRVPALRERPEDIPLLVQELVKESAGFEVALSPSTVTAFQCELWPGNVRELHNAVRRVLALGKDAPKEPAPPRTLKAAREQLLSRFEKDYLEALLAQTEGNLTAAAKIAGLSREGLYGLLRRHGLRSEPR